MMSMDAVGWSIILGVGLLLVIAWQWRRQMREQARMQAHWERQQQAVQQLSEQIREAADRRMQLHAEILRAIQAQQQQQASAMREEMHLLREEIGQSRQRSDESLQRWRQEMHARYEEFRETVLQELRQASQRSEQQMREIQQQLTQALQDIRQEMQQTLHRSSQRGDERLEAMQRQQHEDLQRIAQQFENLREQLLAQLEGMRKSQERQLDDMRHTVDEKLQTTLEKRLGESFRQVSRQLEMVHQGLGEMQQLANGVGDLKRVLSNVKTRGILGEYQLGNLLEQMLTPEQYAANVKTRHGSQNVVEYAIRLPGRDERAHIWLPIDSKFPMEVYQSLVDAQEAGDSTAIERARGELRRRIESFAREIHDKYLDPPNTTDFAVMFLPVEGLYAEVLRDPVTFSLLQRKFRITITGPTTLAALLNSLQMGFRTLAVQRRSSEVWRVLAEVKEEFGRFSGQLEKVYKQLDTAQKSLDNLRGTRTNVMQRKLRKVQELELENERTGLPGAKGGEDD